MTEANEQHEPSYYEIALTNRQVMAAFVILLLCVLGAFFSGVWVGRGGRPDRRAAANGSQAQTGPTGQPLQELQFFAGKSDKPVEKTPDKPTATASPSTSLATDLGKPGDAPADTAASSEAEAVTAEATPAPAATPPVATGPSAARPVPAVASTGSTGAVETAVPTPPAASPSSTPAASGNKSAAPGPTTPSVAVKPAKGTIELAPGEMVVQVFSSSDGEQAKKTMQRVNKGGFKAYLSPLQVGAQTMYRVRIGPFTDRASAQRVADQVRKRFKLDTWITR